jgi:hypothetical protein
MVGSGFPTAAQGREIFFEMSTPLFCGDFRTMGAADRNNATKTEKGC